MGTLHLAEPLPDDVEEGLHEFGRKLLDIVLQPDALAFHRQVIAEAGRFAQSAKLFIARNRVRDLIGKVLRTYTDTLRDPQLTAEHFAILAVGIPRVLALLVGREPPAKEERRLRAAVRPFLDGSRA
jgi:TetR/AcrR family transcriptional regulator, mexJK operon transcriptional repressor